MLTLILPDLHLKIEKAQKILDTHSFDKVVFLGDAFDDFNDTPDMAKNAAIWLKKTMEKYGDNFVICRSNHDVAYEFPKNPHLRCSGFERAKSDAINSILTQEDWAKFKFFHCEQGFWLSHAGIHPYIFSHPIHGITQEGVQEYCDKALEAAKQNIAHPVTNAGYSRGGNQLFGGITWCDFSLDFQPIDNIHQIVGHTPHSHVRGKHTKKSKNHCIDTSLSHIGFLENGIFTFKEV